MNNYRRLGPFLAVVITFVWIISFINASITKDYTPLAFTTPLITLVAAAIFAIKNGNGKG